MSISTITAPAPVIAPPVEKTATKAIKAKIDRLREVRAVKTAAEAEAKTLSAEILEFAGPLTKFIKWGTTKLASIVDSHSTIVDTKALAQGWPEAYAACVTTKPYKQVR